MHSRYHDSSRVEKETTENVLPSGQAIKSDASARPTTGMVIISRAALSPGSPKAAITAASNSGSRSARISNTTLPPIRASARVAMYGTP